MGPYSPLEMALRNGMRKERGEEMGYFGRKKAESSIRGGGRRGAFQTENTDRDKWLSLLERDRLSTL